MTRPSTSLSTIRIVHPITRAALALAWLALLSPAAAWADAYSWNVAIDGGNWSDLAWENTTTATSPVAGPTTAGNTASIDNTVPSNWTASSTQTIVIDVPITIDQLDFTDNNPPASSIMILRASSTSTIEILNWFNDVAGSGRSRYNIDGGVTLNVNDLQFTGRFPDPNQGSGTLRFYDSGGGSATFGYFGGTEQFGGNGTVDFSGTTVMNVTNNGGGASLEGRDTTWIVGSTSGAQTWNVSGGQLALQLRTVGNPFNFHRVGTFDIDMSPNPTGGVKINRGVTGDHGAVTKRDLFTDTSGNAIASGTVRIADYEWFEHGGGSGTHLMWEKVGSNLTIGSGGEVLIRSRNSASDDDVSMFWVMSGRTLTIEGATGDLEVNDSEAASTGRLGVYFEGATIDVGGDLALLGPNTFLNGGSTGGTLNVAGNVTIQSENPNGFGTINSLAGGHTAASDDFDLRASTLVMDGGGSRTLDWFDDAVMQGTSVILDPSDFSLGNFALGELQITSSTDVTLTPGEVLYLSNLIIDTGSTLSISGLSELHFLDPDLSELSRISAYRGDELVLAGYQVFVTPGVGFSLVFSVPEPSTCALAVLGVCGLAGLRRKKCSTRS